MSIVNAVIIKDRKIRFARNHYREIMGILDKKMPRAKKPIDAGYIIVDLDRKILLNCQDAFNISDLKKSDWRRILSEWRVMDYAKW